MLGLTVYAFYFRRHLPPEVPPLLPEDEAELAKGFGCNTLEEVGHWAFRMEDQWRKTMKKQLLPPPEKQFGLGLEGLSTF